MASAGLDSTRRARWRMIMRMIADYLPPDKFFLDLYVHYCSRLELAIDN